ncbi:MAG: SUMF1/EgtB/PvdO family nonheme iron enzyme [Anaerolineales bacterium]|nr:SUMF1/EgtB/PvdO family nonheme iron enzyme [Anaerolineales bacterium]
MLPARWMRLGGSSAAGNGNRLGPKLPVRRQTAAILTVLSAVAWGQVAKVLRGGSWNNNEINARASFRNNNNPDNQNTNVGFRCVVSAPGVVSASQVR